MNNVDVYCFLNSIKDIEVSNLVKEITSTCFQEQDIYIGTKLGVIHKLEYQRLNDDEELSFVTSLLGSLELVKNSPITQLELCGFLNVIIALTNETVIFVNENPLNIHPVNCRFKGVTALAVQQVMESDGYVAQMCIGFNSKRIQLYIISAERLTLLREIVTPAIPIEIKFDHEVVCMASASVYCLINWETESVTDLFAFHHVSKLVQPKITQLPSDGNFLLLGPDGLGIFADAEGSSQRPPIQWGSGVRDFVAMQNHIVAIDYEFITIHSIITQQQVQTIHYPNTKVLLAATSTNSLLIIAQRAVTSDVQWDIVQLVPPSLFQQARQYLQMGMVDHAVKIAGEELVKPKVPLATKQIWQRILAVAAFHKFRQRQFKDAKTLMERANIDFREVISCYPNLLPKSYRFDPKIATVDSGYQLLSLLSDEPHRESVELQYKNFLLEVLVEHRDSSLTRAFAQIVETVLVKLYVELEPQKLFHNFTMMLTDVDYDDLVEYLTDTKHFHACAMVMQWYGQIDKAVYIWSRLMKEEIHDPLFPGIEFLKEVLSNISDPNVIVKNIDWLLKLDPKSTSDILRTFIDRFKNEHDLIHILITDQVMAHIEHYPDTLFDILFDLCQNGLLQNHSHHEHLAQIFLKKLYDTQVDSDLFADVRTKFQQFLCMSDNYSTTKLLAQIRRFPVALPVEEAFVLGQMGEHQAALDIIVKQLSDFRLAETYCITFDKKRSVDHGDLFPTLLAIYLTDERFKNAALDLLESHTARFNIKQVLMMLPAHWPLNRLRQFLLNSTSIRNQMCFTVKMKCGLEQVRNRKTFGETRAIIQNNKLVLDEWRQLVCSHCGNSIDNCSFIKTTAGQMLHKHCYNCA